MHAFSCGNDSIVRWCSHERAQNSWASPCVKPIILELCRQATRFRKGFQHRCTEMKCWMNRLKLNQPAAALAKLTNHLSFSPEHAQMTTAGWDSTNSHRTTALGRPPNMAYEEPRHIWEGLGQTLLLLWVLTMVRVLKFYFNGAQYFFALFTSPVLRKHLERLWVQKGNLLAKC